MLIIQQDEDDLNRALALHARGQLREAAEICRRIFLRSPQHAAALQLLGLVTLQLGDAATAVGILEKSLALRPQAACALHLSMAYRQIGEFTLAAQAAQRAVDLAPESPLAWMHLGIALAEGGRLEEARKWMEKTLAAGPNDAEILQNVGTFCVETRDYERALELCQRGLKLDPKRALLWIAMQKAYTGLGRFAEAEEAVARALTIEKSAGIYKGLAHARTSAGQMQEALEPTTQAVALAPNHPLYHFDRGVVLLTLGQFEEGWKEYEWRRALPEIHRAAPRVTGAEWTGEELAGQRILLYAEQGFGDAIQFARYIPLVRQRGGRIIVMCQKELKRLIARMEGVETCISLEEPIPPCDIYCPLLSLGRISATREETIPANVPYLHADPSDAAIWRERLAPNRHRLKVGLSWAGRPTHSNDRTRSIAPRELANLLHGSNAAFYSLQKNVPPEALQPLTAAGLIDYTAELKDFADTAALSANLDLVITVDTAVGHLAGAMNIPTWIMIALASDWRWGIHRETSAWYPSMRLFRQTKFQDWPSVLARVKEALGKLKSP